MANIKSISHKKSSVIENGLPKLPTAAQLELGELAINFADGYETLSIKNSNNEIVTFTNDQYWKDKEQVIASALNDLNSRILAITVPTNVSDLINDVPYLTASDLDDTPTEDSDNGVTSGGVYDYITEIEEATSAALNDLNERIDDIPELPENIVTGASTAYTIWCGTQAEYNALQTYDNNTVYLIKETV